MKYLITIMMFVCCYTYGQKIEKEPLEINIYGGLNFSYNDYGGSRWIQPAAPYVSFSSNKTGNFSLGLFYAPGPFVYDLPKTNATFPGYLSVGVSYGFNIGKIKFKKR